MARYKIKADGVLHVGKAVGGHKKDQKVFFPTDSL